MFQIAFLFMLQMDSHKSSDQSNSKVGGNDAGDSEVYCICRSSDVSRFMIGCEQCNGWYHGDCIKVTADEAQFIKHWYCHICRERNPALHIKYSKRKPTDDPDDAVSADSQHHHKHKKFRASEWMPEKDHRHNSSDREKSLSLPSEKERSERSGSSSHKHEHSQSKPSSQERKHSSHSGSKHDHHHSSTSSDKHHRKNDEKMKSFIDRKKSSRMCGNCSGCTRTEDCSKCDFCKDMKKYGGPNKLRQKCRLRQCKNKGLSISALSNTLRPDEQNSRSPAAYSSGNVLDDQVGHGVFPIVPERAAAAAARKAASEKKLYEQLFTHTISFARKETKTSSRHDKPKVSTKSSSSREDRKTGSSSRLKTDNQSSGYYETSHTRRSAAVIDNSFDAVPRQCLGPECIEPARVGSKYCSDECGLKLANNRIFEILPSRIKDWHSSPCVADDKNRIELERIRGLQLLAREKLFSLDRRHRELNELLDRAKRTTVQPEPENSDTDDEAELNVFCITCGMEVSQRGALRHMEKCFNRFESQTSFGSIYKTRIEGDSMFCDFFNAQQGTYCKRLKVLCPEHLKEPKVSENEVCGCPLVTNVFKNTGEFCRIAKRKCNRHHAWEKLRRAEIDMERMRQWMLLDELFEQERHIRTSMADRSGVLALLLHRTIDHELAAR